MLPLRSRIAAVREATASILSKTGTAWKKSKWAAAEEWNGNEFAIVPEG
jgi:hypothetical protein